MVTMPFVQDVFPSWAFLEWQRVVDHAFLQGASLILGKFLPAAKDGIQNDPNFPI